jgi:hypothetical protein
MLFHINNYLQFIFYLNVSPESSTTNNEYQNRE